MKGKERVKGETAMDEGVHALLSESHAVCTCM